LSRNPEGNELDPASKLALNWPSRHVCPPCFSRGEIASRRAAPVAAGAASQRIALPALSIAEGSAIEAEAEWVWDDKKLQGAIPISSGLGSVKLP